MVRKSAYLWILSPLALLWPASAVAVGQDVTSGSPVAISYAGDMPPAADAKVPPAPDAKAPTAPMADAAAPAAAAPAAGDCGCNAGGATAAAIAASSLARIRPRPACSAIAAGSSAMM